MPASTNKTTRAPKTRRAAKPVARSKVNNRVKLPKSRPTLVRTDSEARPAIAPGRPAPIRSEGGLAPYVAYHAKSGADHQAEVNRLSRDGFRMISLSLLGDPADPRYAAVWVKRSGPAWVAIHGVNAEEFQAFCEQKTAQGYVPTLIAATGPAMHPLLAGVFEKNGETGTVMKFGLTAGSANNSTTFNFHNRWAQENNFILRSAAIYGTIADRRYAAVWGPNTTHARWVCRTADTSGEYQKWFEAYQQMGYRPAGLALSTDQIYLSFFRDDSVGECHARHGMTPDGYQTEFNQRTAQGFYPICVEGGGLGTNARYAAIFAKQEAPVPRLWTATGGSVPSALAEFDALMKNFMTANNVRAGTLAIARNGTVKLARGYTWAEPGYTVTQPSTLFRIASLSKAFTCAAIKSLYDAKKIAPNTAVFPTLGIITKTLPSQNVDPRINTITVHQLVDHTGGWDRDSAPDPVFQMRHIARSLGLTTAPTKRDLARYMFGEPLQFAPGTNSKYCNFGYVLLSLLVEQVTGQRFVEYVKQHIVTPLGGSELYVARTLKMQRLSNEAFYDQKGIGLTALTPHQDTLAPLSYGGEGWLTESMDGSGGLVTTATGLVKLIHTHAVWGLGGRAAGAARAGSMAGTTSLAVSRPDGVDYAYIFNTRDVPAQALHQLGEALTKRLNEIKW